MSAVLGIDLSSKALDLCLLDEDDAGARWDRLPIPFTHSKVELGRAVADAMPGRSWYEHHGVYLIALEEPMGQNRQAIAALYTVLGAVAANLPHDIPRWTLRPAEWKLAIGLSGNAATSKGNEQLRSWALEYGADSEWPTDAQVALAVAWTAREINAKAVALAIGAA